MTMPHSAPKLGRILAAFVDYLVMMAVLLLAGQNLISLDLQFVVLIAFGTFYFGLGNSRICGGQTLGKRAFGLRTVAADLHDGPTSYLSVRTGIARYFALYGLPSLFSEITPLLFRHYGVASSPALLELHMLVVMAYSGACAALVLLMPDGRGVHDLLCRSLVVTAAETQLPVNPPELQRRSKALAGSMIAACLWLPGVVHDPQSRLLHSAQYTIESRFPIRITSIDSFEEVLLLRALVINDQSNLPAETLAQQLGVFLLNEKLLPADGPTRIVKFNFITLADGNAAAVPRELEFSTVEKTVVNAPAQQGPPL